MGQVEPQQTGNVDDKVARPHVTALHNARHSRYCAPFTLHTAPVDEHFNFEKVSNFQAFEQSFPVLNPNKDHKTEVFKISLILAEKKTEYSLNRNLIFY